MNKTLQWILIVAVIALAGSFMYKQWATNQALRKIYAASKSASLSEYMDILDSNFTRFYFSDYTRQIMKLNYLISKKKDQEIHDLLPSFQTVKMTDKEKAVLFSKMFGYYIENGNIEKAVPIRNRLETILKDAKDKESLSIRQEVEQVASIYIDHNTDYIPILQEYDAQTDNAEMKAVYCYRLAKLYYYKGDETAVKENLQKAKNLTKNSELKSRIEEMIQSPDKLY